MRVVHSSDLHLGLAQFDRMLPSGINVREADIARAFTALVDRTIALQPELFVVAGDHFHRVRPTNQAIMHCFRQLSRLTKALPTVRVVLVSGNHESPRAGDVAGIMQHFAEIDRVHVADRDARHFWFADLALDVLTVPDVPGLQRPVLEPDPRAKYAVLVMHGEVEGMPVAGAQEREAIKVTQREVGLDRWGYVALGHYHVYTRLAENMAYSGATEYSSSDIWRERREEAKQGQAGKVFVERDLETGAHIVHALPALRPVFDLPSIDATELGAAEIDARIRDVVEASPIDDAIVRLRIVGITRETSHALDQKQLRALRRRALNFHLVEDRPARISPASAAMVRALNRRSVDERVKDNLSTRTLASDVDRDRLVALGAEYLAKAGESELAKSTAVTELAAVTTEQRLAS